MLDLFLLLLLDAVVKFLVLLDFFLKRVFKATVLALFGSLLVIVFRVAHFLHGLHFCSLFALHLAQTIHCCLSSMLFNLCVSLFFFPFFNRMDRNVSMPGALLRSSKSMSFCPSLRPAGLFTWPFAR